MSAQKANTNASGSRPLVKVKNQKVSLVTQSQVSLDRPRSLNDSFAITVSTGNHTTTYTVHRPIGITDLEDDDWVVTPVGDIPSLLSRAEDPAQQEINKKRAILKNRRLVEKGFLIDKGGVLFYPPTVYTGEEDRNALLSLAEAKLTEHKKTVREEFKKTHPSAKQEELDAIKFNRKRVDFLDEKQKIHEKDIAEFLSDEVLQEEIKGAIPQSYRTRSGPLMDRDQVACTVIGKSKTVAAAEDKLNSWVYSQLVLSVVGQPPRNNSGTASQPAGNTGGLLSRVRNLGGRSDTSDNGSQVSSASAPAKASVGAVTPKKP